MAGRSGRAGVARGESGGSAAEGVNTACGESFLFISVSLRSIPNSTFRIIQVVY